MARHVVLYAFDTMADWEYAHITTALGFAAGDGDDRFRLRVVSNDGEPVRTLGGLRLLPDGVLADIEVDQTAMVILPGGQTWADDDRHAEALSLARECLNAGVAVAGICGATKAMARAGLCARHVHTLDPEDPPTGYPGSSHRVDAVAAHDGDLITAIGEANLEFARMVFQRLELDTAAGIDQWYASFKDIPDARS